MKKFNTPVSDFTLDEFKKSQQEAIDELFTETTPFTWAKLKEFCNTLTDEQLSQTVRVIQEEGSIEIMDASEVGADHYLFENDDEFSVSKSDFDPKYHLEGKYNSFEEAIENERHTITPKTNVYLYERL